MTSKWLVLPVGLSCLLGCPAAPVDEFSAVEREIINTLSPPREVPPDPTNKYADNAQAALLGQKLFFERRYSGAITIDDGGVGSLGARGETKKIACSDCHDPQHYFSDKRSSPNNVSVGAAWTIRNAPSLVNVQYYVWHGWGGKQDSLWTQASLSPESRDNTNGDRCDYAHMLFSFYRAEYDAIFDQPLPPALDPASVEAARFPAKCKPVADGGVWETMTADDRDSINRIMANQGKAVAAYERLLVSGPSPFDRFAAGDTTAMTASARRGLKLFIGKAACVKCHAGSMFTDDLFHNEGVPQEGMNVPAIDEGRFPDLPSAASHTFSSAGPYSDAPSVGAAKYATYDGGLRPEINKGLFRTKGLRNVGVTAPYMHTGGLATLADVVEFYDVGGGTSGFVGTKDELLVPLNLSTSEKADLVAFLETLTGEPVPAALTVQPQ